ncbi:hypothetical protein BH10BDE1_BH10BDE1_24660 [soil metagenome]
MRFILFSLLLTSSIALSANFKSESKVVIENSIAPFQTGNFGEHFEIRIGEISGIDFIREPGGAIKGIKTPEEFVLPLTLESSDLRRKTQLKKTKTESHPSVDWNQHRVTLMSVDAAEQGYKVKLRSEIIPLRKLASGEILKTMISGDEIRGPGDLVIRHTGYVNAHMTNSTGASSSESSCQIEALAGAEKKIFHIPAPLRKPVVETWKKWTFVFTKTDPDGGTMEQQEPVEFQITEN